MVDDRDLAGLDPYDLMASEANRIDRHLASLPDSGWEAETRCAGWNVRDLTAHLAASEAYNRACLDGTVADFMADIGAKGATDLAAANEIGIRSYDGQSTDEILGAWRAENTANREAIRARDGGEIDSSVGAYPARWQAFHLAFELATHADDLGVPSTAAEANDRVAWQAQFGRFALKEAKPDTAIDAHDGRTHVKAGAVDVELPDAEFVEALAARLPADTELDAATAAALSVTP
jgi:uncharacterized protein (TIGR03083 family)